MTFCCYQMMVMLLTILQDFMQMWLVFLGLVECKDSLRITYRNDDDVSSSIFRDAFTFKFWGNFDMDIFHFIFGIFYLSFEINHSKNDLNAEWCNAAVVLNGGKHNFPNLEGTSQSAVIMASRDW